MCRPRSARTRRFLLISGGGFTLTGGLWSALITEPVFHLLIRLSEPDTIVLRWPNLSSGYVLQQAANLGSPKGGWIAVDPAPVVSGSNWEVTLPVMDWERLFHWHRP